MKKEHKGDFWETANINTKSNSLVLNTWSFECTSTTHLSCTTQKTVRWTALKKGAKFCQTLHIELTLSPEVRKLSQQSKPWLMSSLCFCFVNVPFCLTSLFVCGFSLCNFIHSATDTQTVDGADAASLKFSGRNEATWKNIRCPVSPRTRDDVRWHFLSKPYLLYVPFFYLNNSSTRHPPVSVAAVVAVETLT